MEYNKDNIIKKLKDVKPLLQEKYGVISVALFGSYARNEQTKESDIDIMVEMNTHSFNKYNELYYFLKNTFEEKEIDMVSKGAIKPNYFERVSQSIIYA